VPRPPSAGPQEVIADMRVPLLHTRRSAPSPEPRPMPHFRVLEDRGSGVAPRVCPPTVQHGRSELLQIHVEWPDTTTCGHCRCVMALPTPERCPRCGYYLPYYLVGPALDAGYQQKG